MDFRKSLFVLASLAGTASTFADPLALASVFSDNAVIQRDLPAPIWGVAAPNAKVEVKIEKDGKTVFEADALAADAGKWLAKTKPFSAGGPYSLFVPIYRAATSQSIWFSLRPSKGHKKRHVTVPGRGCAGS